MTRRRLLLALGVALTVVVAAGAVLWLRPQEPGPPGVNQASCDRIKPGMTLAEVRAILGGGEGSFFIDEDDGGDSKRPTGSTWEWYGDEGKVLVEFGDDGVRRARFVPAQKPTLLDWLRERLLP